MWGWIGKIKIGASVPELSISGVAEYEEIYDFILSKVK